MYEKIGKKIMDLASSSSKVVIGLCIILGIYAMFTAGSAAFGIILILALVAYASYVSTWVLYGFGQLIDDVNAIRRKIERVSEFDDEELPKL